MNVCDAYIYTYIYIYIHTYKARMEKGVALDKAAYIRAYIRANVDEENADIYIYMHTYRREGGQGRGEGREEGACGQTWCCREEGISTKETCGYVCVCVCVCPPYVCAYVYMHT